MIDPIFHSTEYSLAARLLDGAALRQDAIAANIANVETPGYRRMDLAPDFASHLRATIAAGRSPDTDPVKPTLSEDRDARAVRPDGNNVELEKELLAMSGNSVDYNYLAEVVSTDIKQLRIAVTGAAA